MKTQEIKELFANAKSTDDIIKIFNENPGLEDQILEIGKQKGIDLNEPRELSDFELNLITGGLSLKQGVVTTMAALMIAGPVIGAVGGFGNTQKAYASETNTSAQIEQVQLSSNNENSNSTASQVNQTTGITNNQTSDNAVKNTGSTQSKHEAETVQPKEAEHFQVEEKSTWDTVAEGALGIFTNFFSAGCKVLMGDILGEAVGGSVESILGLANNQDNTAQITQMINNISDNISQSTADIINANYKSEFRLTNQIDNRADKIDREIESQNPGQVVNNFVRNLDSTNKHLSSNSYFFETLKALNNSDTKAASQFLDEYYNQIKNLFEYLYNSSSDQGRNLYTAFEDISSALSGVDTDGNQVAVLNGQSMSIFDVNKQLINGEYNYVFDNQSIDQREKFMEDTLKKYVSAYNLIGCLINYEISATQQSMFDTVIQLSAADNNITKEFDKQFAEYVSNKTPVDENFYAKYNQYLLDGPRGASIENQGAYARYKVQFENAKADLANLKKSFQNGMKSFRKEAAALQYEKAHPNIYYNGKTGENALAYEITNVVSPDDSYTFSTGSSESTLIDGAHKNLVSEKDYNYIHNGFRVDNKISSPYSDEGKCDMEVYTDAINYYDNWKSKLKNNIKDNYNVFEKSVDYDGLSNTDIAALCKHYKENNNNPDKLHFDGIYVGTNDLKINELSQFRREIYTGWFLFVGETTEKRLYERGIEISKTFKYLDENSTADNNGSVLPKEATISSEFDFYNFNGFKDHSCNLSLARLKDVTGDYLSGLQAAIDQAANHLNSDAGSQVNGL